jgi:hypothetical protein
MGKIVTVCLYIYSFQNAERQHEDVLKVYEWFLSHQKLISEDTVSPHKPSHHQLSSSSFCID